MGEAYVQFFMDMGSGKAMPRSARYTQHPRLEPAEQFMTVACDSGGRVVVRKRWNGQPLVCATARRQGAQLVERAQNVPHLPWPEIEAAVAHEVATAAAVHEAERDAHDPDVVGAVPAVAQARREPLWKRAGTWIAAGVLLALIVAGVLAWERFAGKYLDTADRANGAECTRDTQCASRACTRRVCVPVRAVIDGERCTANAQCASGKCALATKVCVAK